MCFSATASFTSSAILSIGGLVLLKKHPYDRKTLLAMIPLLFGIQQFSEGILWLAFDSGSYPNSWGIFAKNFFLVIAYALWPIWSALAFLVAEREPWRKSVMSICLLVGVIIAVANMYILIVEGWPAQIIEHSISYGQHVFFKKVLYGVVVLLPYYFSSLPKAWISGIAITIGFIIADYIYTYTFASVWCFEAAIISIGLYFTLQQKEPIKELNN